MRKQRVATGFTTYAENALLIKSQTIGLKMADNPVYETPIPSLVELGESTAAYNANLSATPSKENTQAKKDNRIALIDLLNRLALYVAGTGGSLQSMKAQAFR